MATDRTSPAPELLDEFSDLDAVESTLSSPPDPGRPPRSRLELATWRFHATEALVEAGRLPVESLVLEWRTVLQATDASASTSAHERAGVRLGLAQALIESAPAEAERLLTEAVALEALATTTVYLPVHLLALHAPSAPSSRLPYARRAVELADGFDTAGGFRITARLCLGHHLLCVGADDEAEAVFAAALDIRRAFGRSTAQLESDIDQMRSEAQQHREPPA